ncbi:hypothetical protein AB0K02_11145 [Streptomyces sp. NPDC049597]
MTEIRTVRGPVDSGELGVTLMHEHVFVRRRCSHDVPRRIFEAR